MKSARIFLSCISFLTIFSSISNFYYFFKLHDVGDCLPLWVAQPWPLFEPYAAVHDRVSAIGVCRVLWVGFFGCVILSGDSNPGLWVSVYLNLTHALNPSATTASYLAYLLSVFIQQVFNIAFKYFSLNIRINYPVYWIVILYCALKTVPFYNWTTINHLNTWLIWYSKPLCV